MILAQGGLRLPSGTILDASTNWKTLSPEDLAYFRQIATMGSAMGPGMQQLQQQQGGGPNQPLQKSNAPIVKPSVSKSAAQQKVIPASNMNTGVQNLAMQMNRMGVNPYMFTGGQQNMNFNRGQMAGRMRQ